MVSIHGMINRGTTWSSKVWKIDCNEYITKIWHQCWQGKFQSFLNPWMWRHQVIWRPDAKWRETYVQSGGMDVRDTLHLEQWIDYISKVF